MNQLTNVVQCQRRNSQITFVVQCKGQIFNVQIGTNFLCSCSLSTVANRKTCCHIVWVLHYVFSVEKSNSVLTQIEVSREIFDEMRESLPHELPESVTQCENGRTFSAKLKNHPRFETEQIWYLSVKKSGAPSRCSSCMVPKQIKIGDLHLYVKGLLYLEKDDRVVETKLRSCLKRKCVANINSSYNNIRPLNLDCAVKKDPLLGKISKEEVANIELEGFKIQGMQSVLKSV